MSVHYTRDFVWVVITSINSLGSIPYQKLRDLGVTGIYLSAQDNLATDAKRKEVVNAGFKCGLFYPANTEHQFGDEVAYLASKRLAAFAKTESGGQTPVLLDFEPSDGVGSTQFWTDFMNAWRGTLRPGRVTDFTPEPFKAYALGDLLLAARMDAKVQYYFGDMSPVDGGEAREDWLLHGWDTDAVRGFVDGGRRIPPPIFYQGRIVRALEPGTCIWNANLLREAGLI